MDGLAKIFSVAALAVCGSLTAANSHAGEPLTKMATSLIHAGGNNRTPQAPLRLPANRLDLAPPTLALGSVEKAPESFPNVNRHNEAAGASPAKFGAFNSSIGNQRVPSRAEQLVRNFHREGLPVARLFQNENSLVHLGLNQKGKPGLWIVEKIH